MRKSTCLLLCLTLACFCLFGAARAGEAPLYVMQDHHRMLLEGRDIFTYDSAEILTLRHARGMTDDEGILGWVYSVDGTDDGIKAMGLYYQFNGLQVMAMITDSPTSASEREALLNEWYAQSAHEQVWPVVAVHIQEPGISGPLGIQIGMTLEELMVLPVRFELCPDTTAITHREDAYVAYYQDIDIYKIYAYVNRGSVARCYVTRAF
jgi:hypothetical protein